MEENVASRVNQVPSTFTGEILPQPVLGLGLSNPIQA